MLTSEQLPNFVVVNSFILVKSTYELLHEIAAEKKRFFIYRILGIIVFSTALLLLDILIYSTTYFKQYHILDPLGYQINGY